MDPDLDPGGSKTSVSASATLTVTNIKTFYIYLSAAVPHPCKQVVEKTWPALSKCCDKFADDERITERACRTIRSVVSAG
jgi:hypothetical protein